MVLIIRNHNETYAQKCAARVVAAPIALSDIVFAAQRTRARQHQDTSLPAVHFTPEKTFPGLNDGAGFWHAANLLLSVDDHQCSFGIRSLDTVFSTGFELSSKLTRLTVPGTPQFHALKLLLAFYKTTNIDKWANRATLDNVYLESPIMTKSRPKVSFWETVRRFNPSRRHA